MTDSADHWRRLYRPPEESTLAIPALGADGITPRDLVGEIRTRAELDASKAAEQAVLGTPAPGGPSAPASLGPTTGAPAVELDLEADLDRRVHLPDGLDSLLDAASLTPTASIVLLMLDHPMSLRELRRHSADVPDLQFEGVIREALRQGIFEFV